MEREDLKRILAQYGMAGLMAAGGVAFTAQPAMSAWAGSKKGAGSTPAVKKSVAAPVKAMEVKSVEELEKVVKELQPGKSVTIRFGGKEILLEAKGE